MGFITFYGPCCSVKSTDLWLSCRSVGQGAIEMKITISKQGLHFILITNGGLIVFWFSKPKAIPKRVALWQAIKPISVVCER